MNLTEHRKYALVVLGLFFVWGGISYYWYACGIKNLCAQQAPLQEARGLGTGGHAVLQPPQHGVCKGLVFTYIIPGAKNDIDSVKGLEYFLYTFEGEEVPMDGTYDAKDIAAVKRFQEKYRSAILTPYGLTQATGSVRESTLYAINSLYCDSLIKQ